MNKFVVISHTHWDREWYMNFESFRLRLVDLIDRLFPILESHPSYIFHLDAQTVVLEDYLAIRPENEDKLKKYIHSGNLRVGPWYLQNDFYLTAGEVTVRNLQIGSAMAEKFGKCGKVGYVPDQFGVIAQLPQILSGFGIGSVIFGRGFRDYKTDNGDTKEIPTPAEFTWKSEDGSECVAVHMKKWYNNAQHIPADIDRAARLLDGDARDFAPLNTSPYILLMNGVDHLEAQDDILEIISALRERGYDVKQYGMDEYTEELCAYLSDKKLPSYTGAFNRSYDYDLLRGCWSSRIHLKRENVRAQDLLINLLEPLYTYLSQSGMDGVFPSGELDFLWKSLLKNHPHDSICGCSIDAVHSHMEDRFHSIEEMGNDLLVRGMKTLAHHSDNPYSAPENYVVAVFNPTERNAVKVVTAQLDFPVGENVEKFAIFDDNGKEKNYEIIGKEKTKLDIFSPLNLPGVMDVDRFTIAFEADVPSFCSRSYAVVTGRNGKVLTDEHKKNAVSNERYCISFNGSLVIEDKKTGRRYENPLVLEDTADKGDSYVYRKSMAKPILVKPSFAGVQNGVMCKKLRVAFDYDCPTEYDFEKDCRATKKLSVHAEADIILESGSDVIGVEYTIENNSDDHRIRLVFALGENGRMFSDSAFDCNELTNFHSCPNTDSDTHCNATFVSVGGKDGFAVYTEGQHEVERTLGGLAFTVLRSTGWITRNSENFSPLGGECWRVDGNQMHGKTFGKIGVELCSDKTFADLFASAKLFRRGLIVHADSFDSKKYAGGRFVVQGGESTFYYIKDKYAGKTVRRNAFFECESSNICVTCCKTDKEGNAVVRFVNMSSDCVDANVVFGGKTELIELSEKDGKSLGKGEKTLHFKPKQIITVRIER